MLPCSLEALRDLQLTIVRIVVSKHSEEHVAINESRNVAKHRPDRYAVVFRYERAEEFRRLLFGMGNLQSKAQIACACLTSI